jgi:hypothetical protein
MDKANLNLIVERLGEGVGSKNDLQGKKADENSKEERIRWVEESCGVGTNAGSKGGLLGE